MTRWATSVQKSFAEAASAGVSSPASRASSARSATASAASTSAWQAASSNLVFWKLPIEVPNAVRSFEVMQIQPTHLPKFHRASQFGF